MEAQRGPQRDCTNFGPLNHYTSNPVRHAMRLNVPSRSSALWKGGGGGGEISC